MGSNYIGETDSKRVMRVRSFLRAQKFISSYSAKVPLGISSAITLAGPSCGDYGALKHILKVTDENIVFVDYDKEAYENAKKHLKDIKSKATIYNLSLGFTLEQTFRKFSFMNLDLCGNFTQDVENALRAAGPKLVEGGVLSITFFRGHDGNENNKYWKQTKPYGYLLPSEKNLSESEKKGIVNDRRRYGGYTNLIEKYLFSPSDRRKYYLLPIYDYKYQTNSPMAIMGFQKVFYTFLPSQNEAASLVSLSREDTQYELRKTALDLRLLHGYTSKQVGEIMNIPSSRVAAWKAHTNMGTYI